MKTGDIVWLRDCGHNDEVIDLKTNRDFTITDMNRFMVEMEDAKGKKWAWPMDAKVIYVSSL